MSGILVIRGGAIGDFVLTLPAIALLREALPGNRIEILGYEHIAALADNRFYADAVRSMEYGPLSGFFHPTSELDPELVSYFAGFSQVVSYLFDPDGFFEANLRRAGVRNLIVGNPRIAGPRHAALQLAEPMERLALFLMDPAARLYPSTDDFAAADRVVNPRRKTVVIHPGSGSPRKNWPVENWFAVVRSILFERTDSEILIVTGEADEIPRAAFTQYIRTDPRVRLLPAVSLPVLAAILSRAACFLGHDSGISHIAAAVGCPCVLLFGPTDPAIWAPVGGHVHVIRREGNLAGIPPADVLSANPLRFKLA